MMPERKCNVAGCYKMAAVGEMICDDHLIASWVEVYKEGVPSLQSCGHDRAFIYQSNEGTAHCVLCEAQAQESRDNGTTVLRGFDRENDPGA